MLKKTFALFATSAVALALTTAGLATDTKKTEGEMPMHAVKCPSPCDFSVKSHDKAEVAAVVKEHAKSHHNMSMSDQEAAAMVKVQKPKS